MRIAPTLSPTSAPIPPAGPRTDGWIAGAISFSGIGQTYRTWLRLDAILGRQGGYDSARGARIAAAQLTEGDDRPAAAVTKDGDGRYRIYAAAYLEYGNTGRLVPLAFERGNPRIPGVGTLDQYLTYPEQGVLEVRDGTKLILPYDAD